jgi:hypothetical protein
MAALSYDKDPNIIVGVGIMGQYLAKHVGEWLGAAKLVLADGADAINVDGERTALSDFARSIAAAKASLEVVAETVDVTSEDAVAGSRPQRRSLRLDRPASETLHNRGPSRTPAPGRLSQLSASPAASLP